MRQSLRITATCAIALLTACQSATEPQRSGVLSFSVIAPNIIITNKGDTPVFVFIVGRNSAPLVDWFPCVDATLCPPVPARGRQIRSFEQSFVQQGETEAIAYWWQAVTRNGVVEADEVRSFVIRVR